MLTRFPRIQSIYGVPLEKRNLVRLTFMDEAGISANEPFAIVSGVIVHGDNQLDAVEYYLSKIKQQYLRDRTQIILSTKDIWHGTKDFKGMDFSERIEIINSMVSILLNLNLPVCIGAIKKNTQDGFYETYKNSEDYKHPKYGRLRKDDYCHILAFIQCCAMIERHMQRYTDENTILMVEDKPEVRRFLKRSVAYLKGSPLSSSPWLPARKIRERPAFLEKHDSSSLQLADLCAFLARGALSSETIKKERRALISNWYQDMYRQMIDLEPVDLDMNASISAT